MPNIQIFDPALCCNTGVCGVEVDQNLVNFAADVDWAKQNGAQVERFNLAQQPLAFAENPTVKGFCNARARGAAPGSGRWRGGLGRPLPQPKRIDPLGWHRGARSLASPKRLLLWRPLLLNKEIPCTS